MVMAIVMEGVLPCADIKAKSGTVVCISAFGSFDECTEVDLD